MGSEMCIRDSFAAEVHRLTVSSARPRRCKLLSVLRHPRSAASSGLSSFIRPDSPNASRIASVKDAKRSSSSFEVIGSKGMSESGCSESVRRASGAIRSDSHVSSPRSSFGAMAVFARARIVVCEPRCEILGTSERFFSSTQRQKMTRESCAGPK